MQDVDILADPRMTLPVPATRAPAAAPGDLPRAVRLGMPHLDPDGLSEGWLLSEAVHHHWLGVAAACGTRPGALRDIGGARVHPAIVSWVHTGSPVRFEEDEVARLRREVAPTAAGGWRSVLRAEGGAGAGARLEIASVLARREGPSNASLAAAEMDAALSPPALPEMMPRAARILRARARAMREAAGARPAAPILTVRIGAHELDGLGLLPPAALLRHFAAAEAAALGGPWSAPPVHRREVHAYANLDPGDWLDLDCDMLATEVSPEPAVFSSIAARRASDGMLIAACETVRC